MPDLFLTTSEGRVLYVCTQVGLDLKGVPDLFLTQVKEECLMCVHSGAGLKGEYLTQQMIKFHVWPEAPGLGWNVIF